MGIRSGQALTELIVGLFALTLVVAVLCAFAVGIAGSLREQNALRAQPTDTHNWKVGDSVDLPKDLLNLLNRNEN